MDGFDIALLSWFNQFARRSYVLDAMINDLAYFNLLKGIPFVLALTWLWVTRRGDRQRNREIAVATMLAAFVAIIVGRLVATELPLRLRPMSRTDIPFVLPYFVHANTLRDWSAFPSDTAMLFSTIATGLWFASARLGLTAHLFAATVIAMPRIYVGLHHPTDIIAGTAIGVVIGVALVNRHVRPRLAAWPLKVSDAYPVVFTLVAMLVSLQMATMFDDARAFVRDTRLLAGFARCRISGATGCDEAIAARVHSVDHRNAPAKANRPPAPARTPPERVGSSGLPRDAELGQ